MLDLAKPQTRPYIMGIVNTTPDSFSDGGQFLDAGCAVKHACRLIEEGADMIDVGPESTRPDSEYVSPDVQIERCVPVICAIRRLYPSIPISIDTRLARVASAALAAGATMINDVSALRDDEGLVKVVADGNVPVVLMHMKGTPKDMQRGGGPEYDDVVNEVASFLRERVEYARSHQIKPENIILDPGIGFGKQTEDNLQLVKRLDEIVAMGHPVLLGASRKRFIGEVLGVANPGDRDSATLAVSVYSALKGVSVVRVHGVRRTREALDLIAAIDHS